MFKNLKHLWIPLGWFSCQCPPSSFWSSRRSQPHLTESCTALVQKCLLEEWPRRNFGMSPRPNCPNWKFWSVSKLGATKKRIQVLPYSISPLLIWSLIPNLWDITNLQSAAWPPEAPATISAMSKEPKPVAQSTVISVPSNPTSFSIPETHFQHFDI